MFWPQSRFIVTWRQIIANVGKKPLRANEIFIQVPVPSKQNENSVRLTLRSLRGYSTVNGRKIKLFLKIFFSVNTTYNEIIFFLYLLSYSYIIPKKVKRIFLICVTCFFLQRQYAT